MSVLVFLAAFAFYLAGASPSVAPRDAADMAAAAWTLGVAHPPGYPLYAALGKAWLTLVPWGDPAYRLAVLSCAAGAAAAALLFGYARKTCGARAALAAAALALLSAPLWKFSLIQEKYALHALAAAALLYLSEGGGDGLWRRARLSGFVVGLGLVNHQSLLLCLPGLLLLWRAEAKRHFAPPGRLLAEASVWALAGLSLYAFLWVRLGSLGEALAVALRARYGSGTLSAQLAKPFTSDGAVRLFGWSLRAWAEASGLPAAAAALAGGVLAWREDRARTSGLLVMALGSGSLFVVLSRVDSADWVARSVLEPAFVVPALVAAVFAARAVAGAGKAESAAALALVAAALWTGAPSPERRDDYLAYDYVRNLRRALPPGSAALVSGDTALFGLRWLELTAARSAPLELTGAGLSDPRAWLASRRGRADAFVVGLAPGALPPAALAPEGLVQRAGPAGAPAPVVLRRSGTWRRDESYARDAKLSYAFAAWSAARLLEARGARAPETLDLTAAALDPADYTLE